MSKMTKYKHWSILSKFQDEIDDFLYKKAKEEMGSLTEDLCETEIHWVPNDKDKHIIITDILDIHLKNFRKNMGNNILMLPNHDVPEKITESIKLKILKIVIPQNNFVKPKKPN